MSPKHYRAWHGEFPPTKSKFGFGVFPNYAMNEPGSLADILRFGSAALRCLQIAHYSLGPNHVKVWLTLVQPSRALARQSCSYLTLCQCRVVSTFGIAVSPPTTSGFGSQLWLGRVAPVSRVDQKPHANQLSRVAQISRVAPVLVLPK